VMPLFKCPKCGRLFKNAFGLKSHYTWVHKDRSHQCPVCQRSFNNERGLLAHLFMKAKRDGEHAVYFYLEHNPSQGARRIGELRKRALKLLKVEE